MKCRRCQGPMYRGYDQDWCCLHCGEVVYDAPDYREVHRLWDLRPRRGRPRKVKPT